MLLAAPDRAVDGAKIESWPAPFNNSHDMTPPWDVYDGALVRELVDSLNRDSSAALDREGAAGAEILSHVITYLGASTVDREKAAETLAKRVDLARAAGLQMCDFVKKCFEADPTELNTFVNRRGPPGGLYGAVAAPLHVIRAIGSATPEVIDLLRVNLRCSGDSCIEGDLAETLYRVGTPDDRNNLRDFLMSAIGNKDLYGSRHVFLLLKHDPEIISQVLDRCFECDPTGVYGFGWAHVVHRFLKEDNRDQFFDFDRTFAAIRTCALEDRNIARSVISLFFTLVRNPGDAECAEAFAHAVNKSTVWDGAAAPLSSLMAVFKIISTLACHERIPQVASSYRHAWRDMRRPEGTSYRLQLSEPVSDAFVEFGRESLDAKVVTDLFRYAYPQRDERPTVKSARTGPLNTALRVGEVARRKINEILQTDSPKNGAIAEHARSLVDVIMSSKLLF